MLFIHQTYKYKFDLGSTSGKDGKLDSWFLFNSYKRKQNLVTGVQELVPKMSHISHQTYKILHRNASKYLLV